MCVFAGFFLVSGVFGELCRTGLKCRFSGDFRRFLLRMCVLGLGISFVGPIIAAWIMKKTKWLEFFLYPNKFVKI